LIGKLLTSFRLILTLTAAGVISAAVFCGDPLVEKGNAQAMGWILDSWFQLGLGVALVEIRS
jgi:hypothetical protein